MEDSESDINISKEKSRDNEDSKGEESSEENGKNQISNQKKEFIQLMKK